MSHATGLIALGMGYLVFLNASKEQGSLRLVGRVIGTVIIIVSILSGVCKAYCKSGGCPFSGKASMCHIQKKA